MRLGLIVCALAILSASGAAAQECDKLDPRQHVSEAATREIAGSAQIVFKAGRADGNYKSAVSSEVQNLYERYPDADKIVLRSQLIYLFCTTLKSSDLPGTRKLEELNKFMASMQEAFSAPQPARALSVDEIRCARSKVHSLQERLGRSLIGATHPTGTYVGVEPPATETVLDNGLIQINLVVRWHGFSRTPYATSFGLRFAKKGFDEVVVTSDNAVAKIAAENTRAATADVRQMMATARC